MSEFLIKTDYDCLIKVDDREEVLSPNETLSLDKDCKVLVYPLICSRVLFPFSFDTRNLQTCSAYRFALVDGKTLICLNRPSLCRSYRTASLKVGNTECKFEVGESEFTVSCKEWKKTIALENHFDTFVIKSKYDIAYIKFSGKQGSAVYAFNVKTGRVRFFEGDKIETNENGFDVETQSPLSRLKSRYNITAEGLRLEAADSEPKTIHLSDETVAFNFLSALKAHDTDTAYSFCDETLQATIEKAALKNYFGQILSFYFLSPYEYAVQNENELKIYKFQVKDKKIAEIED